MGSAKDKIIALFGTIVFHVAAILIMFFMNIFTKVTEEDTGVIVNLGQVTLSAGYFEPQGSQTVTMQTSQPAGTPSNATERMLTQDIEESVSIADPSNAENERRQREVAERAEQERIAAEQRRQQEAQRQLEQDIAQRVAGAGFGDANSDSQGSGTVAAGNEGSPFGNSNTGSNTGTGGLSGSFNLTGRVVRGGGLAQPSLKFDEGGKIVLDIVVDREGNVIQAEIGRGTNINSSSMRTDAINAAKRTKFNSIAGTNNQNGYITYQYILK
ncbi:MAG: energy transducer TonB [Tannerella sp.]|jgi:hypothetical protein|nr:energy transducer TonB [Tannerella sp.]